jgi:hypothetical protein
MIALLCSVLIKINACMKPFAKTDRQLTIPYRERPGMQYMTSVPVGSALVAMIFPGSRRFV